MGGSARPCLLVPRRQLKARVSDEADRGLTEFCDSQGVSFTALIEAAGQFLDTHPSYRPSAAVAEMVEMARVIDRERGRRR